MYRKVLELVQRLNLTRGQSRRTDCLCGGRYTLSVSNEAGKLKWHCFRASCNIKGMYSKELTLQDIKLKTREPIQGPLKIKDCLGWHSSILNHGKVVDYLIKNNCSKAYEYYPNRFFYDSIKDRVVFVEYATVNAFSLATGRALNKAKPKWYKYIVVPGTYYKMPELSLVKTDVTYIAEDTASACSLARFGDAVALCGTTWDIAALSSRVDTPKIVICLDADAQEKAHKLKRDLEGYSKVKSVAVVQLSNDAKYLNNDQLGKELKNV